MPQKSSSDPVFTPELLRIIKIFGAVSIGLVIILSFFNERRANNTGEDPIFRMTDANRIYFLNMKAIKYNREQRRDAGMIVLRHKKLEKEGDVPNLKLMIILNSQKDEAYIYLEPINLEWPLTLKLEAESGTEVVTFQNGNKTDHYEMFQTLKPYIDKNANVQIQTENGWRSIWETPEEKEALQTIKEDYENLID